MQIKESAHLNYDWSKKVSIPPIFEGASADGTKALFVKYIKFIEVYAIECPCLRPIKKTVVSLTAL